MAHSRLCSACVHVQPEGMAALTHHQAHEAAQSVTAYTGSVAIVVPWAQELNLHLHPRTC